MLNSLQTDEANRIYTIKKLFTDGYWDYRFSSLFISTLNNMAQMTIPYITKFEYNDIDKYVEIMWDSSKISIREIQEEGLLGRTVSLLSGFLRFCYEDKTMRDILYTVNSGDFKVFDDYMKAIYEYEAICPDPYASMLRVASLVHNIFKITLFDETLIRINLI